MQLHVLPYLQEIPQTFLENNLKYNLYKISKTELSFTTTFSVLEENNIEYLYCSSYAERESPGKKGQSSQPIRMKITSNSSAEPIFHFQNSALTRTIASPLRIF